MIHNVTFSPFLPIIHTQLSRSLRPQLHSMPPRNLLLEHLIHKLMLLNHAQPFELGRLNGYRVHGATAPRNVLDL
jgi:hypothetical protein